MSQVFSRPAKFEVVNIDDQQHLVLLMEVARRPTIYFFEAYATKMLIAVLFPVTTRIRVPIKGLDYWYYNPIAGLEALILKGLGPPVLWDLSPGLYRTTKQALGVSLLGITLHRFMTRK